MPNDFSADDLNQNRSGETLDSMADDPEDEPTQRYTLDIPRSLHRWLKQQAIIEEERSMKEVTIEALQDYRRKHE